MPIRISRNGRAARLNAQAMDCDERGEHDQALTLYQQAARAQPRWAVPWFNMGLLHKYRGEWAASLAANQQALERDPRHEGAIWNAGIAATALGCWRVARAMWRRYGIDMPDSDEPCDMGASLTPIRIHPHGAPEVVWADRIDPARAIIRSIPTPESERRFGDLLLHDGAPNGYRRLREKELAVFDELQLLAPSDYATWELQLEGVTPAQSDALVERLREADLPAESWTANLYALCKACSEGRPDDDPSHHHAPAADGAAVTKVGLALRHAVDDVGRVRALVDAMPGAALVGLACVLPAQDMEARA